jgi:hypothetical protein
MAPLILVGMLSTYASALAVDALGDFGVMWIITGVLSLAAGLVMLGLKLPPGAERTDTRRLWRVLGAVLWGRSGQRPLFRGELADRDADGAAFIETLQDALDPYGDERTGQRTLEG